MKVSVALVALPVWLLLVTRSGNAIPAFARQYGTSCQTCHSVFPKLNDFGKAFKDAGFQFPKGDETANGETLVKIAPVMLGALKIAPALCAATSWC